MTRKLLSLLAIGALIVLPACNPFSCSKHCSKPCSAKHSDSHTEEASANTAAAAAEENQSPATHSCNSHSCTKDHAHAPTEPVTAEQPATEQVTETEVSKI